MGLNVVNRTPIVVAATASAAAVRATDDGDAKTETAMLTGAAPQERKQRALEKAECVPKHGAVFRLSEWAILVLFLVNLAEMEALLSSVSSRRNGKPFGRTSSASSDDARRSDKSAGICTCRVRIQEGRYLRMFSPTSRPSVGEPPFEKV